MNNHPTASQLAHALLLRQSSRELLPSGRSVTVLADDHGERVEVRALDGALQLTIELDEALLQPILLLLQLAEIGRRSGY